MDNTAVMHEGIVLKPEKRENISKIKSWYKEKMIDTGKAKDLEKKIDNEAKIAKTAIGVIGAVATVILMICPVDGPFGEVCSALATPALIGLVSLAADLKKKALIGAKRFGEEKMGFGADGINPDVEKGYEKMEDLVKDAKGVKENLEKYKTVLNEIDEKSKARFEEQQKAAQTNAEPAQAEPVQTEVVQPEPIQTDLNQGEQLVPTLEEDGPKLKL